MPAKFDPYEVLGIDRTADAAAVKKAFRKRARETHPDTGGAYGEFERVSKANIVLSDPAKRSKYDQTGNIDDMQPDNSMSVALNIVIGFFGQISQQFAAGTTIDPCTVDLIDFAKKQFGNQIAEFKKQRKVIDDTVATLKRIEKRLKDKKKANPLVRLALLNQMQSAQEPLRQLDKQIKEHGDAIELLNGYAFDPAMAQAVYQTGGIAGMGSFFTNAGV